MPEKFEGESFLKKYGDKESLPRSWKSVSTSRNDYDTEEEWLEHRREIFSDQKDAALRNKEVYERRERDRADARAAAKAKKAKKAGTRKHRKLSRKTRRNRSGRRL
jgi:hypothetical protein